MDQFNDLLTPWHPWQCWNIPLPCEAVKQGNSWVIVATVEWLVMKTKSTNHNATITRVCTNRPLSCIFWSLQKRSAKRQSTANLQPSWRPATDTNLAQLSLSTTAQSSGLSFCLPKEWILYIYIYYLRADEGNGCWNNSLLNTLVCPKYICRHTLSYPQDTLYGHNKKLQLNPVRFECKQMTLG